MTLNEIAIQSFTLEDLRRMLGWNPWHFWGFTHPTLAPRDAKCSDLIFEYGYQNGDMAGRYDIRQKIAFVHEQLATYLRFHVGKVWQEETMQSTAFVNQSLRPVRRVQPDWRWPVLHTSKHKLLATGVRQLDFISDAAPSYSDPSGKGIKSEFIITLQIDAAITDPDQIVLYFDVDDIPVTDDNLDIKYRIQPVKVTITGDECVIRGNTWLLGRPSAYEYGLVGEGLDPTNLDNMAKSVRVYHEYINPNGTDISDCQAVLTWEAIPYSLIGFCFGCASTSSMTDPASRGSVLARSAIRDAEAGLIYFGPSAYNTEAGTWSQAGIGFCAPPDNVTLRYASGDPLTPAWKQIIGSFVIAELPKRLCACDTANKALYQWQFDLARTDGAAGEVYAQISPTDLENPFGTRRGQVRAWKYVDRRLHTGFVHL